MDMAAVMRCLHACYFPRPGNEEHACLTHEDIECQSSSLTPAGLVVAGESDHITSIFDIVVVLLEIGKYLPCTLI